MTLYYLSIQLNNFSNAWEYIDQNIFVETCLIKFDDCGGFNSALPFDCDEYRK